MGFTLFFIAILLIFGGVAALAIKSGVDVVEVKNAIRDAEPKHFTPRNALFIFGPSANHPSCKLQRRLLKPALAALIREDVTVMEVYGEGLPMKNGEGVDWLDASLLRHAMNAEAGFAVVYVDGAGRTLFRSEGPVLAADIFRRARLGENDRPGDGAKRSAVLRKLKAA